MVRWLEITNSGAKATGLTSVSPWSGMFWNTPTYQERLKPNEAPFEVAYAQYEDWGHEGAWKFEPISNTTKNYLRNSRKIGLGPSDLFRA